MQKILLLLCIQQFYLKIISTTAKNHQFEILQTILFDFCNNKSFFFQKTLKCTELTYIQNGIQSLFSSIIFTFKASSLTISKLISRVYNSLIVELVFKIRNYVQRAQSFQCECECKCVCVCSFSSIWTSLLCFEYLKIFNRKREKRFFSIIIAIGLYS